MKHILIALLLLAHTQATGQSLQLKIVAAAGTEAVGATHTLHYTVGETAILRSNATGFRLEEGFWHAGINAPTELVEIGGSEFNVVVAPNPTPGVFQVKIEAGLPVGMRFVLYDLLGRLVEETFADIGTEQIEMGGAQLANGLYFLNIQSPEGLTVKTFTVQKTN